MFTWRKSSHSGTETDCVEVALAETVGVRDTKQPAPRPILVYSEEAFSAFLAQLTDGR